MTFNRTIEEIRGPGAPPKYSCADEMQEKISEYFSNPPHRVVSTKEGPVEMPVVTITGLALHLGFASRQSLYDYESNEDFSYTIKRARTLIENEYECQIQTGNNAGAIFALKNFGWTDKQETTLLGPDGGAVQFSNMTEDELNNKLQALIDVSGESE